MSDLGGLPTRTKCGEPGKAGTVWDKPSNASCLLGPRRETRGLEGGWIGASQANAATTRYLPNRDPLEKTRAKIGEEISKI